MKKRTRLCETEGGIFKKTFSFFPYGERNGYNDGSGLLCCPLFNKQTKEIVEPAPLMEYAYASSHMQISYFFRFRRQCLFPSFSLSARREKRALSPASVDCCYWWNVFHLSKEGKKICVMDWNTRSFGGTHSRCSISFVRRDRVDPVEED